MKEEVMEGRLVLSGLTPGVVVKAIKWAVGRRY